MVPNRTVDDTDLTDVSTACVEVIFEGKFQFLTNFNFWSTRGKVCLKIMAHYHW